VYFQDKFETLRSTNVTVTIPNNLSLSIYIYINTCFEICYATMYSHDGNAAFSFFAQQWFGILEHLMGSSDAFFPISKGIGIGFIIEPRSNKGRVL